MNTELKAALTLLFGLVLTGEDFLDKKGTAAIIADVYKDGADVPAVVEDWGDLQKEIADLTKPENEADIVSFIVANVAGVTANERAKKVLAASLDLLASTAQKSVVLYQAVHSA